MPETSYVTKDIFDIQVQSLRDRAGAEERITEARFDRIEALMSVNTTRLRSALDDALGRHEAIARELKDGMKAMGERIDKIEGKVDGLRDDISDVRGDVKALSSRVDALQTKFGWYLTLFGVAIAAVLAIAQRMWG